METVGLSPELSRAPATGHRQHQLRPRMWGPEAQPQAGFQRRGQQRVWTGAAPPPPPTRESLGKDTVTGAAGQETGKRAVRPEPGARTAQKGVRWCKEVPSSSDARAATTCHPAELW